MIIIKNDIGTQTKVFAETFEFEAYDQIKKLSNFDAYKNTKIRVMPDAHAGKGCTVGTTMVLDGKVTPNLVGVDIGCGMLAIKLKQKEIDFVKLDSVIRDKIPHGFNVNEKQKSKFDLSNLRCKKHVDLVRASLSIGSLGSGNHYIEVDKSYSGDLYLVIHSGSRKLGVEVCNYYQNLAFKNVNENDSAKETLIKRLKKEGREKDIATELAKFKKPVANKDLAYLEGAQYDDYINDMKIVQEFASKNRQVIADTIMHEMKFGVSESLSTIHNYIDDRHGLTILRKGAVSAFLGERLLIPINMRDGALICTGRGNPDWNYSAPHGAGRLMSRSRAKDELSLDAYIETMEGIFTTSVSKSTIDEAPDAYKPMDEIIRCITDTVIIESIIKPVYNFKSN